MSRDATALDVIEGRAAWAVECADALDALRALPDSSIDAIVTDPPYYRVKGEPWDRAWDSPAAFITWIGELADQWRRVLRPNGSLYCFASPRMAARVEVAIGERFDVLNSITWRKTDGTYNDGGQWCKTDKDTYRSFFPASERIIFAEHYGADTYADGSAGWGAKCDQLRGFVFEPLRAYLASEWARAGLKNDDANTACGTASMAGRHYFARSQWCLPTADHYASLQRYANARANGAGPVLRREYEDLRREYEDLRREYEDLRRPFAVSANVPYTDVWTFATVPARPNKHVCEKPAALIEHIVMASTRPGAVILDCFAGSGVVGEAAIQNDRRAVLVDACPKWSRRAAYRCSMARAVQRLPGFAPAPPPRVETLAMDFEAVAP